MTVHVLLVYNSKEGQTAKIADRIATRLRSRDAVVDVAPAADDPSPTSYDLVIAGDSIHLGRHSRPLRTWLARHREALAAHPLAMFQVSLTSRDRDPQSEAEARAYLDDLVATTGVHPGPVALFAGALAYTRYGWLTKRLMRRLDSAKGGADADLHRDYEYTDWDAVEAFADAALATPAPA